MDEGSVSPLAAKKSLPSITLATRTHCCLCTLIRSFKVVASPDTSLIEPSNLYASFPTWKNCSAKPVILRMVPGSILIEQWVFPDPVQVRFSFLVFGPFYFAFDGAGSLPATCPPVICSWRADVIASRSAEAGQSADRGGVPGGPCARRKSTHLGGAYLGRQTTIDRLDHIDTISGG